MGYSWLLASTAIALTIAIVIRKVIAATTLRVPKGFTPIAGPPGIPIFGHSFQIPVSNPQRFFTKWAQEYGEIYQIQLGFQRWVFLNTGAAAKEIIDYQSAITSSRPPMPTADFVSGYRRFLIMSSGPLWRALRSIVHALLTPKSSEAFKPSQEFETKQLLVDLYNSREDEKAFYNHVRRYTTSVVLTSTYGFRVPNWDCEDVREIYGLMDEFAHVSSPVYGLVDIFPKLLELPKWLHWWEKPVMPFRERQEKIWMRYWSEMKAKIAAGRAPECFGRSLVETGYQKKGIDEMQAAFVAGTMIEAGSETTSSTLNSGLLYLSAHPHVVELAHAEISRVVGSNRSPTFADEPNLPYIRALVKEILRLRPPASVGSPHYTDADLVYKNHFIPKGTVVTINAYAINNSPQQWANPQEFDPSRYLDYPLKSGQLTGQRDPLKRDHWSFGGGRRICPGMHLAENSLFILFAKVLWAFYPKPTLDAMGNERKVDFSDEAYEAGTTTLPKVFPLRLVPRDEVVVGTMRREWEEAKREGYLLGDKRVNVEGIVISDV